MTRTDETAISGRTAVYGVIGDPISHTFSPAIHNTLAAMLGHDMVYAPFRVEGGCLEAAIRGAQALRIAGLNVTVPHKRSVMPFLTRLDATAQKVGAVNTLLLEEAGYAGYNTDCIGLQRALAAAGAEINGQTAVVIGAGGAAYAAVAAAAEGGAANIFVVNRTESRALELVRHAKMYYNTDMHTLPYDELDRLVEHISGQALVIQTTSVGFGSLSGLSPVTERGLFRKAQVVLDVIYSPWETEFLRLAQAEGCVCLNGFDMLVYQAIASFEIWRGDTLGQAFCEKALEELKCRYTKEEQYARKPRDT